MDITSYDSFFEFAEQNVKLLGDCIYESLILIIFFIPFIVTFGIIYVIFYEFVYCKLKDKILKRRKEYKSNEQNDN